MPKFKVDDKVFIVSNLLPPSKCEYHSIPVNSVGIIRSLEDKKHSTYGLCYEVYSKKLAYRQYIYESSLRPLTPSDHFEKTNRQGLPNI